ncbi:MAG: hypothetical protein H6667_10120 [Ardenticatenaceae bacterium]|nr:hypothetical protein [Ardenticatenaceae bacterium]MCB9445823.1 hypothetical protein [Ardenticatenaceae bacterium]
MTMKLTKIITIGLIAVLVLAISAVFVLAQDSNNPTPPAFGPGSMWDSDQGGYGRGGMMGGYSGMMGGRGHFGGGMMNGFYMLDIIAQELGLTADELQAELANDSTIAQLAESLNVAVEDLVAAVSAAHQEQLNQAVTDGWMTQEQADWMQEHMADMIEDHLNQSWGQGFGPGQSYGPGSGGCHGGRFGSGPASQTAPIPQGNGA